MPRMLHAPKYIFNHIPRTGGTSLTAVCRANLQESEIAPHLLDDDILRGGSPSVDHYRFISGHFSLLAHSAFARSRYSMTLVRDPIRTIFSQYRFWRTVPTIDCQTLIAKRHSFADYVRYFADSPVLVNNPFTHHFAALDKDTPGEPVDCELLLAIAKHNLAAFDFVGVCEHFDKSVRLLCSELGWSVPEQVPHENRSGTASAAEQIDPGLMEFLLSRNRFDLELYEFAKKLFFQRLNLLDERWGSSLNNGCDHVSAPRPFHDPALPDITQVERNRFIPFPSTHLPPRAVTIERVSAAWLPDSPGTLEVAISFRPVREIDDLIVGFMIHDAQGRRVFSTNTFELRQKVNTQAQTVCRVAFRLASALPPGRYFVSPALHRLQTTGYHFHWIDRAASFEVPGFSDARPGLVRPVGFESTLSAAADGTGGSPAVHFR